MASMRSRDVAALAASILVCQLAGVLGSFFTSPSIASWYPTLKKPFFNPPNWVFAPVWITLFTLMGVSIFLVWRKGLAEKKVKLALGVFAIHLLVNVLWSAAFFGIKSPLAGLLVIVPLWILVVACITLFARVNVPAAMLLIPYLLWVSFAAVLNAAIVVLN